MLNTADVDGQSLKDFERSLANNLYRIWNRMASGSYFPSPVKTVSIPKKAGAGTPAGAAFPCGFLWIPAGKSAHQALAVTRQRCWWHAWVLEFDI